MGEGHHLPTTSTAAMHLVTMTGTGSLSAAIWSSRSRPNIEGAAACQLEPSGQHGHRRTDASRKCRQSVRMGLCWRPRTAHHQSCPARSVYLCRGQGSGSSLGPCPDLKDFDMFRRLLQRHFSPAPSFIQPCIIFRPTIKSSVAVPPTDLECCFCHSYWYRLLFYSSRDSSRARLESKYPMFSLVMAYC